MTGRLLFPDSRRTATSAAICTADFVPKLGLGGPVAETMVPITVGVMCPSR